MSAGAPRAADSGDGTRVRDRPDGWSVRSSEHRFRGRMIGVRTDEVAMPGDTHAVREVVEHPGSVAVLALDDAGRVLLIQQYRHPVNRLLWEAPAGLRDVSGETPLETARRELLEETGHRAGTWHTLVDFYPSPGMSDERIRVFLARDLTEVPEAERDYVGRHEETHLPLAWVPLDEAVDKVIAGDLHNACAVAGILAASAARAREWRGLRPPGAPEE